MKNIDVSTKSLIDLLMVAPFYLEISHFYNFLLNNYLKGINFRKFREFLPKLRNLILAKIMKISKFAKFANIKFFSSKNRGFLNFLFLQESHKLE